jgi:membrane protein
MSDPDLTPRPWYRRLRPLDLLLRAAGQWYGDKTFELGAALAYYAVFSIAPVILIAIAVASLFLGRQAAEGQVSQQLEATVGHTVAQAITGTLKYAHKSGSGVMATLLSSIVLLVSAMGLFGQLQSALNAIWGVKPKSGRGWWGVVRDRLWPFLAVLGAAALILVALLANTVLAALGQVLPPAQLPAWLSAWRLLTLGVSLVVLTVAVGLVFKLLPDVSFRWRHVWVGAAVTAVLIMLGNYLISLYLRTSGVASTYGAAGSLVVILLWVYYSAQVLLFGAEFTEVYAENSGDPIRPADNAEPLGPDRRRPGRTPAAQ